MLNYSTDTPDGSCQLYGGSTVETASRNVSNGRWLRADKNCAYYIIVGNNMRFNDEATFYFTRGGAASLVTFVSILFFISLISNLI